ncbi:hypothetical protein AB0K09_24450 [Streptomyces sp. NPDC049577]|uniref:hypothetical protein n=1 Tax=Streptomyces sp. NPDC049577 TaxID=3155153 RepID=UPI00342C1F2E
MLVGAGDLASLVDLPEPGRSPAWQPALHRRQRRQPSQPSRGYASKTRGKLPFASGIRALGTGRGQQVGRRPTTGEENEDLIHSTDSGTARGKEFTQTDGPEGFKWRVMLKRTDSRCACPTAHLLFVFKSVPTLVISDPIV